MQIHVVDGTYELFRSFYGAPAAQAPDGREVGAVRGLLRSLWSLCKEPAVSHVAVAFDTVIESFRNRLYDGYKTGDGIDPALWAQFPLAEAAARALGLVTWSMVEFEADDALATAAARFGDAPGVARVVLCSPDKDLAQCVRGERIVMRDRRRRLELDELAVIDKYGVRPGSIPDWLALVGDDADGIPGVAGWGEVSAAQVLTAHERLESIPRDVRAWRAPVRGAARLALNLFGDFERALLWRTLATLRTDVPLAEDLDDLRWRGPGADLPALCAEIGFERFAAEVAAGR